MVLASVALLSTAALHPVSAETPFLFGYAAVFLSAWYGGLGPGLLCTALSSLVTAYAFLPPEFSFAIGWDDGLRMAIFSLVAISTSSVMDATRRAEVNAVALNKELKGLVVEGTNKLEDQAKKIRQQTNLLHLVHDAILIRDAQTNRILFWNNGAEHIYQWSEREALGQVSHVLLKTEFPSSLAAIEAELAAEDLWEGTLVHTRRDGTQVAVASRWVLQWDEAGVAKAILEFNRELSGVQGAALHANE